MDLSVLFQPEVDLHRLREVLDGVGHAGRVMTVRGWGKDVQARLYEAAKGFMPVTVDMLAPADRKPLEQVVHDGKNSLPAFSNFQKIFCRAEEGEDVWGYNLNSALVSTTVGPGYFVVHPAPDEGEVDIDYTKLPPKKPDAWPPILPNDARLSRFVYHRLVDRMRGLSTHVSIGRGYRGGHVMDAWFVLVREDPKPA